MGGERKLVDDGSGWGTCLECGDQCQLWEGICASGCDIKSNTSNSTRDETAFMFDDDGSITAIARLPKMLTDAISEFEDSVGTVINILDSTHNENIGQTLSDAADRFGEVYWRFRYLPDLSGLTSLSDAAAESLSKHGGALFLNGLTELSDGAAESLSNHEGELYLESLTSLSDGPGHIALAESLSKHEGELSLFGITSLSDAAAESLSKHEGDLDLGRLTTLSDGPGHIALAESLSKHEGDLFLNGLTELSDGAAERLSKHNGDRLCLGGLTELSDAAAESLSKHEGYLMLGGLTELSDAAAESLSEHGGNLRLASLTKLSDAAAESLAKIQHKFSRDGIKLKHLPASAAQILRDAGHG